VIRFSDSLNYQLRETYSLLVDIHPPEDIVTEFVLLNTEGRLTIRRGYAWNGADDPAPDLPSAMRASLIHDACYFLLRTGLLDPAYKLEADKLLRSIAIEAGMHHFLAQVYYQAVRQFGEPAIDPLSERVILSAP
jgi:hypothetical protein